MKTRNTLLWLSAVLVLAVTACGEEPTGPEASDIGSVPAFAKPPGGGGKPAGDIALTVEFADGADRIRSDGNPMYVHEQEFVSAIVRPIGMLYFQSWKGKRKDPVLRGVTVDLRSPVDVLSPSDTEDFKTDLNEAGDAWPVFTSDVTLHTRDTDGGLYTMAVGSALVDGGKIGFNDYGDGGAWEWRLLFDSRVGGLADRVGLCAMHPDENTWLLTADGEACGGAVDGVTELWRVQGSVFTHVADFDTPMHLTLTRLP